MNFLLDLVISFWVRLKYVPKLYAVIVKLCQLMREKENHLKKSLWFMFDTYRADFLSDQLLKNLLFFMVKMKNKFRFEKNWSIRITIYIFWLMSSSWTQTYLSRWDKIISSPRKVVIKTDPLPQRCLILDTNLCRVHVFGDGYELFVALKDQ